MKPAAALFLVGIVCASVAGCEAIDDFSPFHVLSYDAGAVRDLKGDAAPVGADLGEGDAALVGDMNADAGSAFDLSIPDLAGACGVCSPGAQRTIPCGNCGMETDTCTMSCQWSAGACQGDGPCVAGTTQPGGCNPCSQQVCGNDCQWSACQLQPGNACEYTESGGTLLTTRPCNCTMSCHLSGGTVTNPTTGIEACLSSCQWESRCVCARDPGSEYCS